MKSRKKYKNHLRSQFFLLRFRQPLLLVNPSRLLFHLQHGVITSGGTAIQEENLMKFSCLNCSRQDTHKKISIQQFQFRPNVFSLRSHVEIARDKVLHDQITGRLIHLSLDVVKVQGFNQKIKHLPVVSEAELLLDRLEGNFLEENATN